ncbi:Uncharacterized protein BP5553_01592 [Venustampulla echinocandica]|uniref:Trichothecene 3-O-acetyltransferase n=1 Tax=Venustampulla echinocandica TaxID=2656787 RepID=A0A370U1J5_9HELO|nr:Uncharacterized protein BP5553_01592 [Venustampulla echinocandica]RDL41613.1 Uncharacterized protein BP5553_01592 [Venustampulla echinocandica]
MDKTSTSLGPDGKQSNPFVTPEQYGLPTSPAMQRLSPLDMNMPRLYGTRWILSFPLESGADKAQIYEGLRRGLAHTISSIPWIAGNIGPEDGRDLKENRVQIVDSSTGVRFQYNDLTGALPSYAELKAEHFPLSKFTTAQLSPLGVMPEPPEPVMAAQANFIEGGLLLTVGVHHAVCDASAVGTIIDTWAHNTAATSTSEPVSFSKYDTPSNDRSPLMVGAPGAKLTDFPEYILQPTPSAAAADVNMEQMAKTGFSLPPMTTCIFHFSPASLVALKAAAEAYSTNDALSGFLWRHMTLARNPIQPSGSIVPDEDGEKTTAILYAANIRTRCSPPLPHSYLGNASMGTITERLSISTLTSSSGLKTAASAVRKSLQRLVDTPNRIPLTIGLIDARPDPTELRFAYHGFLGPDISSTSWADIGVYESVWGQLGKVESFRVPGEGADGAIAVFPRLKQGGLEVMVALEAEAMQRLIGDPEFVGKAELWA